jgi:methionine-rich copper-binding protein CopC
MLARILASLTAPAVLLALAVAPVFAHAKYDRSDPAAGATVASAPAQVKVWFGEEPSPTQSTLMVTDASGARVDTGDGKVDASDPDRKLMTVSLKSGLANGVYTVKYHTVTEDDNGILDGSFSFGVGTSVPAAQAKPTEKESGGDEDAGGKGPGELPNSGSADAGLSLLPLALGLGLALAGIALRTRAFGIGRRS